MRRPVDADRIRRVMARFAEVRNVRGRVFLTGGATAVLVGWRASTIDVDLKLDPGVDAILRDVPTIKEELEVNIELASPDHFIPALPGWEGRSLFIERIGELEFYQYDPYSQVLAKIERGHERDLIDVREMLQRGLVDPARAWDLFQEIEPELYRFPAIDPPTFHRRVRELLFGE